MFGALDISTSGLVAQRTRMDVISANLANQHSLFDAKGNYAPFRRRLAVLAPGDPVSGRAEGVHVQDIALDRAPGRTVKVEPGSPLAPYADKDGCVEMPNIEPANEMVDALTVARAYEANITAAEATKSMIQASIRLLA